MQIKSEAFQDNGYLSAEFSCEGANSRPPLEVIDLPKGTQSIAIIVDDPDAPSGLFTHWIIWNIPATKSQLEKGQLPQGAIEGKNDFQNIGYGGPCPPHGEHRYNFEAYALDSTLDLPQGASYQELEAAMKGHVLETSSIVGRYRKHSE